MGWRYAKCRVTRDGGDGRSIFEGDDRANMGRSTVQIAETEKKGFYFVPERENVK